MKKIVVFYPKVSYIINSVFASSLIYAITILILVYDLYSHKLYYIFYSLMFLLITKLVERIRKFLDHKDCFVDGIITEYLYGANTPNKKESYVKQFEEEIIEYVNADYITASLVQYSHNTRITENRYVRTQQLFILLLAIVYFFYNYNKYSLMIYSYKIPIGIIFVIIFMLLRFIHRNMRTKKLWTSISDKESDKESENMLYNWSFRILYLFTMLFVAYIILRNKLTLYPVEEVMFISERFTSQEKHAYIINYLAYLQKLLNFDNETSRFIKEVIILNITDIDTMSLDDIRNKVIDVFFNYEITPETENASLFKRMKTWFLTNIYYNK